MESAGLWKVMGLSHEVELATFNFVKIHSWKVPLLIRITMGSEILLWVSLFPLLNFHHVELYFVAPG